MFLRTIGLSFIFEYFRIFISFISKFITFYVLINKNVFYYCQVDFQGKIEKIDHLVVYAISQIRLQHSKIPIKELLNVSYRFNLLNTIKCL